MRIANIPPPKMADILIDEKETYHLVLADWIVEYNNYRDFYSERVARGDYVILDSMTHERTEGTDVGVMIEAYRLLKPQEIVLPDLKLASWSANYELARTGAHAYREAGIKAKFMAVPHGDTFEQYLASSEQLSRIPGVDVLGIYEETDDQFYSRFNVVASLRKFNKTIHLLGKLEHMRDILNAEMRRWCRGVDSGKLVCWGLQGDVVLSTEPIPAYKGRPENFEYLTEEDVSQEKIAIIRANIAHWRELVQ